MTWNLIQIPISCHIPIISAFCLLIQLNFIACTVVRLSFFQNYFCITLPLGEWHHRCYKLICKSSQTHSNYDARFCLSPCQIYLLTCLCISWMHFHPQLSKIIITPTQPMFAVPSCILGLLLFLDHCNSFNKIFSSLLFTSSRSPIPLKYHFIAN